MATTELSPRDIKFTQASIKEEFTDGTKVLDLFRELLCGMTDVDDVPPITCVHWKDDYWAYDGNRRLLVYKKLQTKKKIDVITVKVISYKAGPFKKKLTTTRDGNFVACRDNPNLSDEMDQLYKAYQSSNVSDSSDEDDCNFKTKLCDVLLKIASDLGNSSAKRLKNKRLKDKRLKTTTGVDKSTNTDPVFVISADDLISKLRHEATFEKTVQILTSNNNSSVIPIDSTDTTLDAHVDSTSTSTVTNLIEGSEKQESLKRRGAEIDTLLTSVASKKSKVTYSLPCMKKFSHVFDRDLADQKDKPVTLQYSEQASAFSKEDMQSPFSKVENTPVSEWKTNLSHTLGRDFAYQKDEPGTLQYPKQASASSRDNMPYASSKIGYIPASETSISDNTLNGQAQNVMAFMQTADVVSGVANKHCIDHVDSSEESDYDEKEPDETISVPIHSYSPDKDTVHRDTKLPEFNSENLMSQQKDPSYPEFNPLIIDIPEEEHNDSQDT